jgi:hypothetical protein
MVEYTRATGSMEKHMDMARKFDRMVRFDMMENGRMTNPFEIHRYCCSRMSQNQRFGIVSICNYDSYPNEFTGINLDVAVVAFLCNEGGNGIQPKTSDIQKERCETETPVKEGNQKISLHYGSVLTIASGPSAK